MSDTEPDEGLRVQVEPGADAAAAEPASAHSASKKQHTCWWESGEGEFSRELTAGVFANSRVTLPGAVVSGLGLSGDCQVTLSDPRTGRSWGEAVTSHGSATGSPVARMKSGGLRAAVQALGLQPGGTLVMRRHKAAAGPQPCSAHVIEVAAGVLRLAGGDPPGQKVPPPIPKMSRAEAEAAKQHATTSRDAQPGLRHWVEVEGSGEFMRQYLRTKHDRLQMTDWMAERLGIGSGSVTLTHQQRQWTVEQSWEKKRGKQLPCLMAGWKKFAKEVDLRQGDIITLSKDSAAAPQPAIAFAMWRPTNAGAAASQGEQAAEQQEEEEEEEQQQRRRRRRRRLQREQEEGGRVQAAALSGRHADSPLESSRLLTRLSDAGRQQGGRPAAGREAKRSRLDMDSTGREGTAAPAAAAAAASPAMPAAAAAPAVVAAQPAMPAVQAPQAAGASAADAAAGPPLQPLDMYRAIKPAVMGCGAPGPTASSFLRIFLNHMDRSTQQANFEQVQELHSGGASQAGELREWVELTVAGWAGTAGR